MKQRRILSHLFVWSILVVAGHHAAFGQDEKPGLFDLSLEEIMNLDVSVTVASRSAISAAEAPSSVYIITRNDIDQMGLRSLGDALNCVPGFTVGKGIQTGQQKNIYVRGEFSLLSEGILILYNGQRLNDGLTGGGVAFNADYPLDNIRQIEVIRGPGSALYGANAFVGVVNLVSMEPDEGDRFSAQYRGGSLNGHMVNLSLDRRLGVNGSGQLYGSFYNTEDDLKQRPIAEAVFDSSSQGYTPVMYRGRINSEDARRVQVGGALKWNALRLDGYYNTSINRNNWGAGALSDARRYQNDMKASNARVGASYAWPLSCGFTVHSLASFATHYSNNDFRVENFPTVLGPAIGSGRQAAILESKWTTSTLNLESFVTVTKPVRHETIFGANVQIDFVPNVWNFNSVVDSNGDGIFDTEVDDDTSSVRNIFKSGTRHVYAAFVQHTWHVLDWMTLTGGLRLDQYNDFDPSLNPRLAVVVTPGSRWTIKALYGRAFRAPAYFELNKIELNEINGNRLVKNPHLDAETIHTVECQVAYHPTSAVIVSIVGFENRVHSVIREVPTNNPSFPTQVEYQNAGSRKWRGVEIEARWVPFERISMFSNYSYVHSEDEPGESNEGPVVGIPRHSLNAGVNWAVQRHINFNVNANARFGWNGVPALDTGVKILEPIHLPAYVILNTHLIIRDVLPRISLSFSVFNLFNTRSYYNADRIFVPQGIPGSSRQILVGANYTLP